MSVEEIDLCILFVFECSIDICDLRLNAIDFIFDAADIKIGYLLFQLRDLLVYLIDLFIDMEEIDDKIRAYLDRSS